MRIAFATLLPLEIAELNRFLRPPLTAGYLCAYAEKHRPGQDQYDIVDTTELVDIDGLLAVAKRMLQTDPQIVAFSVYVWNHCEVAEVCRHVRRLKPEVKIIVGGPEIAFTPSRALKIFEADWACTGEGELPFLGLLNALEEKPSFSSSLSGMLHRRNLAGTCAPAQLANPLDDIPSPYRNGYLRIDEGTVVDLETTRGCPYRCRFCLYGKTLESLRYFTLDRVEKDVAYAIEQGATSVYLMDPTFNYPRERCRGICRLLARLNPDRAVEFSTEARAEIMDEDLADAFVRAGIRSVEIGLQSSSKETLKLMQRGLGTSQFITGCRLLYERGIRAEIGTIVGLPGDTEDSIRRTVDFVVNNNLGQLNVYQLQVLPGSEYHKMAEELGLSYEATPPYFIRDTPTLNGEQIASLVAELDDAAAEPNAVYNRDIKRIAYNVTRRARRAAAARRRSAPAILERTATGVSSL